jgi:hypothetical protein
MTNHNKVSKSVRGSNEYNNEQRRQRQRRRIQLNQVLEQQHQSPQVPTIIDAIIRPMDSRDNGEADFSNNPILTPVHPLPSRTNVPYQPLAISSILRLSSTMRNNTSRSTSINLPTFATPIYLAASSSASSSSPSSSSPTLTREGFIHILDCALAICDEVLDDPDLVDEESDHP